MNTNTANMNTNTDTNGDNYLANLPSIASSASIGSLNISVWEGRKKDKTTEQEITISKGARSSRAASVHKHLLPEAPALEAIKTLRGEIRTWFNRVTLPWDDNGGRLITTGQYFELMDAAAKYERRFTDLVNVFLNTYSTEISKQAFELGALFNRDDYPTVEELRSKFGFTLSIVPVPLANDFRINIGNEALKELQERMNQHTKQRIAAAVGDAWNRVKEQAEWVLTRMNAVLDYDPDAVEEVKETDEAGNVTSLTIKKKRRPKLHESMLDQGLELCSLLRDLNVTNDPKLEEARHMLERALVNVDIDSLKESKETQQATKKAMEDILNKFDF
jgi:hypothetical protein